jgi:glycerophosphoryl diester phosphodiesterase
MENFLKIGYRGAAGYEPENTLRSFLKAIELKCGAVEFDVHIAADGEPAVIHDNTLERTTNGTGEVSEKTLVELKTLDAGLGEKIPQLEEVLNLIDRKVVANIELKTTDAVKPAAKIIEKYISKRGWTYDDFIVSSFNHLDLWLIKELLPELKTGALIEMAPCGFGEFAKELEVYSVNLPFSCATKEFVGELHEQEIRVFVYTIDEPSQIAALKTLGVDGIFSNYPDRL